MIKLLSFLHLLDDEGALSITSIAVYVCLYKLIVAPQASLTEIGGLLISLGSHQTKRYIEAIHGKER